MSNIIGQWAKQKSQAIKKLGLGIIIIFLAASQPFLFAQNGNVLELNEVITGKKVVGSIFKAYKFILRQNLTLQAGGECAEEGAIVFNGTDYLGCQNGTYANLSMGGGVSGIENPAGLVVSMSSLDRSVYPGNNETLKFDYNVIVGNQNYSLKSVKCCVISPQGIDAESANAISNATNGLIATSNGLCELPGVQILNQENLEGQMIYEYNHDRVWRGDRSTKILSCGALPKYGKGGNDWYRVS